MLPNHLFDSSDGNLYDTRIENWHTLPPLRANYQRHHRNIKTIADLKATLRAGPYAWPGGYPLFFIARDGDELAFRTVIAEFKTIARAMFFNSADDWKIIACDINYESEIYCAHTGEQIESAYEIIKDE